MTTQHGDPLGKRAQLARLLQARASQNAPRSSSGPLSYPQQRLWFFDQLVPGSNAYNLGFGFRIKGPLDLRALEHAINLIIARHDVLRATFPAVEGQATQIIGAPVPLTLEAEPSATELPQRDAVSQRLTEEDFRKPFDLAHGPLFRARLYRFDAADHLLTATFHHIVSDAWSVRVFARELTSLYFSGASGTDSPLEPLPIQYSDFARSQHESLRAGVDAEVAYWRGQLEGAPETIELPTDAPRPSAQTFDGALATLTLSPDLSDAVKAFGARHGATLFMTTLACFQLLLSRLSGQNDIVVGSPTSGRSRADVEGLIGCFLNTLVLRTRFDGDPTVIEFVRAVRETALEAYAHDSVPFERLVEALQPHRDLNRTPFFQIMFNMLVPERSGLEEGDPSFAFVMPDDHAAKFDLTLYVIESERALTFRAVYNRDLFSADRITEMLRQMARLLEQAVDRPDARLSQLSLLTGSARGRLPDPSVGLGAPRVFQTVPALILEQASHTPDAVALDRDGDAVTYGELVQRASAAARALVQRGHRGGDVVALTGEPGPGFIVGMVAALMARGILLTLDRRLPMDRRQLMLQQADARSLLSVGEPLADGGELLSGVRATVSIDADHGGLVDSPSPASHAPLDLPASSDPAYIFFTSGTTGVPKAVLGRHAGLSHFVAWQREVFGIGPGDRSSQLTGLSFDVVLREIFLPLTSGATLCLRPKADAEDLAADRVLPWMDRARVTVLHTVPTLAQSWLADVPAGVTLATLRRIFFAGEPLSGLLVGRWRRRFPGEGEVINLYGPTETTLAKCFFRVPADCGASVQPVGRPLPDTHALVLRDGVHLCGVGEIGEIVIRTPYRTLGYANAKEETRKRFVQNPHGAEPDDLMYLTGDRGRYRPDGVLEILGRLDDQVKIRGARVELDEVTAALCRHPLVRQGAVVAIGDGQGGKRLVAYAVASPSSDETASRIHRDLQQTLPDFMVPSAVVLLDALPVTANGKLDRKKLPEPKTSALRAQALVPPRTPIEEDLAVIWRELLGGGNVDVHQNFFDAGGHSLLATQLLARVRRTFKIELPLRRVYERPTIADIGELVREALSGAHGAGSDAPIVRRDRSAPAAVSSSQRQLWFIDQMLPGGSTYNVSTSIRLRGVLDVAALDHAIGQIVRRHDVLRTTFAHIGSQVIQTAAPFTSFTLPVIDVGDAAVPGREARARAVAVDEVGRPFDLERGPLFRAVLVRVDASNHLLVVVMHHAVSDVWSLGVFVRELAASYRSRVEATPAELPELRVQYEDYAEWQQAWLKSPRFSDELSFWKEQLAGPLPVLDLPAERRRPPVQTFRGARAVVELPRDLMDRVKQFSRREGATLFTTLAATFNLLLHRYSGADDILVGFPVAGRTRAEVESLIGFFVNMLVLRTDLSGDPTFRELVHRVHDRALAAYTHQEVPFERLVEELQPDRELGRNPLFQVALVLHNTPLPPADLPGLSVTIEPLAPDRARFDLTLSLWETADGANGALEYSTDLFEAATIERMVEQFATVLDDATGRPDVRLSNLALQTAAQAEQVVVGWNATAVEYPRTSCVHQVVEAIAARTPDTVAVSCDGESLTYGELNARANRLARHLRALGVSADTLVSVCLPRSLNLPVALLGILKAGGAYVPLDPNYPAARLEFMLADTNAAVLVTERSLVGLLPSCAGTLCLDEMEEVLAGHSPADLVCVTGPDHLAYVTYTSGSTGVPKGVAVRHRGVLRLLFGVDYVRLGPAERILHLSPVSFDASTFEIWGALAHGGCCVLLPGRVPTADAMARIVAAERITTLWLTAALFNAIIDESPQALRGVRQVIAGGEALSVAHVRRAQQQLPGTQIINGYGPTESTTFACCFPIPPALDVAATSVPIGRPIGNTRVYVVDGGMRPVPVHVTGELYIGGDGLARGYLNRPELTAERFVPDPFATHAGERLYRTGDLVRWRHDGTIEFVGRVDHQVKVRGFRIEPGEIEAALATHATVREAVVVVREDVPGDKRLVAYVVPERGAAGATPLELREWLKSRLPEYMVPAAVVVLDRLPISPNGKLDRQALPAPERDRSDVTFVPPRSDLERQIAALWAEVLGVGAVGLADNFFDLGGHSLLLVQVHRRLREQLGLDVSIVELFQFPTIESLARHVTSAVAPEAAATPADRTGRADIAIVGMAGRFPGAATVDEFWANLAGGKESITFFADDELEAHGISRALLSDPGYVKARGVLAGADRFDADFFGYTPREAELLDPQQRVFLECAWEAMEHAGYDSEQGAANVGVFAGTGLNTYLLALAGRSDALSTYNPVQIAVASDKDFLPTRVSYKLNLHGPSVNVQTACSTSLVAVHLACRALADGECDMALAGGVRIAVPQESGYRYQEGSILSPDGHCRAFDRHAQGTVSGSGAAVIVLKRLDDAVAAADTIYAVIKGSAINNDGADKVGFTAPGVRGQAAVIAAAHRSAGVAPATVAYVEAHGTGTALGDPVEIAALTSAFRSGGDTAVGSCAIGSLKTNVGHLDAAAGVAGLIKAALAVYHGVIPPSLHFDAPNPAIDFDASPFFVNTALTRFVDNGLPRRVGVSSFGLGGTNAHVVLEQAPDVGAPLPASRPCQLLVLSARSAGALDVLGVNLAQHIEAHPDIDLSDVAYTLQLGRRALSHRRVILCRDRQDALVQLSASGAADGKRVATSERDSQRPGVAFMFSGQGAQHIGMARELYAHEAGFRDALDRCAALFESHIGLDLRGVLHAEGPDRDAASRRLTETSLAQPALFAVEYALAQLWLSWGVVPEAMIGHSIGEYVAACLAGVMTLEDAVAVVALRGRLMQEVPSGAMLAVPLPAAEVSDLLGEDVSIAAVNAPGHAVLSGPHAAIAEVERRLAARGIEGQRLVTSHAFHSAMMDPLLESFGERISRVALSPPQIPYVSNVTGTWIQPDEAASAAYWVRHLRGTVQFAAGVETLLAEPGRNPSRSGPRTGADVALETGAERRGTHGDSVAAARSGRRLR